MTARARRSTPRLAPVLALVAPPTTALTSMAARRFDLERELIATPCGRIVEREQTSLPAPAVPEGATPEWLAWMARRPRTGSESTYRLWEPVIDGNTYAVTREKNGKVWGLAHTRRASQRLTFADAVKWEMAQQRRAMDAIIASCRELQGEHPDSPRRNRGVVHLSGTLTARVENIEKAAREARAKP